MTKSQPDVDKLSPLESRRYSACKKQISEGLQTCFDTGLALTEIRDSKLYREDFDTFAEFCQQTYQLGKTHAYRLIESAEIKKDIEDRSPQAAKLITNEHQARALADVPAGEQVKLLKDLARGGGSITAESIKAKIGSTFNDTTDTIDRNVSPIGDKLKSSHARLPPVLDATGWEIPDELHALWARRGEVRDMMAKITNIETQLLKLQKEEDPLFAPINFSSAVMKLQFTHMEVRAAELFSVCTTCQGRAYKKCAHCKGRGFLTQQSWKMVPSEIRAIREKGSKK